MLLYILRHAEAEPIITSDRERKLTSYGKQQATEIGHFCLEQEIFPLVLLASPIVRARQTAEQVIQILENTQLIEAPWMACGMRPETALEELKAYAAFDSVMVVGHEPDLSYLIAFLLGVKDAASLNIGKASLTAIKITNLSPGSGVLKFLIPCSVVEKI